MHWWIWSSFLLLASCATQVNPSRQASEWQHSPTVTLQGAKISSNILPLHGKGAIEKPRLIYSAQTTQFQGPLRWCIIAEGMKEQHLSMEIEAIQIHTQRTRRSVNITPEALGKRRVLFQLVEEKSDTKKQSESAQWKAIYTFPEILQLFPKADGKIVLAAKICIRTSTSSKTEWVNFALLPTPHSESGFTFRHPLIEHNGVPLF